MISIINLCYNTGRFVTDTLASINNQIFKDFEVIIIDDASSDDSASVVEGWLKENANFEYKFFVNEKNKGISKSLNFGLKQAQGEYIAIIGDDIWEPNFLEKGISIFKKAPPSVALVSCNAMNLDLTNGSQIKVIDRKGDTYKTNYPRCDELYKTIDEDIYLLKQGILNDSLYWVNTIVTFMVLIRKEKLEKIGGFCEGFAFEDYPTWFTLSRSYDFVYYDKVLGTYITHENNFSLKKTNLMNQTRLDILISNYKYIKYADTKRDVQNKICILSKRVYHAKDWTMIYRVLKSITKLAGYDFRFWLKLNRDILLQPFSKFFPLRLKD